MQSIIKKTLPFFILGILIFFSTSSLTLFKANDAVIGFQSVIAAEAPEKSKEILPESGNPPYLEDPEEQNFIEQLLGKGWKSSIRLMIYVSIWKG